MENLKKPTDIRELKKPTNIEELANNIDQIFTQFIQEELGNRLSQFGMKGLRDVIITKIKNYKPTKEEVRKDVKK